MLEVTKRLGGTNYVLWGGREGYDTLLNTDLRREGAPAGPLPPPRRRAQAQDRLRGHAPHRAQADGADEAPVRLRHARPSTASSSATASTASTALNIEANHATLAGHSFHHEVAYAVANGMFGSIDANRGDPQNGWDTDQFPNSVDDLVLPLYEILQGGGFTTGGFNFDAKLRRQSIGPDRPLPRPHRRDRHARPGAPRRGGHGRGGHARGDGRGALRRLERRARRGASSTARVSLADLAARVEAGEIDPQPVSGPAGALRERRQPAHLGRRPHLTSGRRPRRTSRPGDRGGPVARRGVTMGHVLGIDVSTTAIKADPARRVRRRPRHRLGGVRARASPARSGASRTRALVGRHGRGDPGGPRRDRRAPATTSSPSA